MTRLAPVVWNEGMHLAQHHFQAQSRYFEESIRFTLNQLCFQAAGFASVGLDQEALLNGVATLGHARGIMPDGTPFQIPEADPAPESLDVRPLFGPTEHQRLLYLTLPPHRPGAANCATDGDTDFRYTVETRNLRDETTGLDERPVTVGRKNFTLTLEAEGESIELALPLARIRREGSGEFRYDPSFIPPCIQIGGSPRLLELLGDLLALLERKAQNLSRERARAGDMVA